MTAPAAAGIRTLLPPGHSFELVEELPAGQGVVDLLAIQFNSKAVETRLATRLDAVTMPLRVRALDALRAQRWTRVEDLAARVGSKPRALQRSTLAPLIEAELVDLAGSKVRSTGRWQPLPLRQVAVELKLDKWRHAVRQADNAAWCCDHAWVVLDARRAQAALNHLDHFRAFGVGLALLDAEGEMRVVVRPRQRRQVRWLRFFAAELAWSRLCSAS